MKHILTVFEKIIEATEATRGRTYPNPPVGAAFLDENGRLLSTGIHLKQGTPHAERLAMQAAQEKGTLQEAHTLLVTLEPCNHHGQTPPCTEAILSTPIKKVIVACKDPNPHVKGDGIAHLRVKGIEVSMLIEYPGSEPLVTRAQELISPFSHWVQTKRPWITIKRAFRSEDSMIPPPGQKTFTSKDSLTYAHTLRKRAQAIITGSGTILADNPLFTVRHIEDHPEARRWIILLDRRQRVPASWKERAKADGFQLYEPHSLEEAYTFIRKKEFVEVLIEAGPTLSTSIIENHPWNEIIDIHAHQEHKDDTIKRTLKKD